MRDLLTPAEEKKANTPNINFMSYHKDVVDVVE